VLTSVFWIGLAVAVYAYLVFPAAVWALARVRIKSRADNAVGGVPAAGVTVIIPAYNEELHLAARIRNVLDSDYPRHLLDVVVVSDASTDRTNEIATTFAPEGVRLVVQERRQGKTAGLNRVLGIARGDVVVFTDANTVFPPEAIRRLVSYFVDTRVGLVSGFTKYAVTTSGELAEATNAYTSLERTIKIAESRWGMCVGADGAIFAMRRSLYRILRDDDINDLVLPLSVIDQGYRCVLADDAYCSENTGKDVHSEFRRQSRIANRSLRAISRHAHLLNPIRFPLFSFFLFSHKVVRLLVPLFLVASLGALVALSFSGGLYLWVAVAATLLITMTVASRIPFQLATSSTPMGRVLRLANVLLVTNLAFLHGWWRFATGHSEITWQHDRAIRAGE